MCSPESQPRSQTSKSVVKVFAGNLSHVTLQTNAIYCMLLHSLPASVGLSLNYVFKLSLKYHEKVRCGSRIYLHAPRRRGYRSLNY